MPWHYVRMNVWDEHTLNVLNRCPLHFCKLVNDNCINNRKKAIHFSWWGGMGGNYISALEEPELELCWLKENIEPLADNNTLVQVSWWMHTQYYFLGMDWYTVPPEEDQKIVYSMHDTMGWVVQAAEGWV